MKKLAVFAALAVFAPAVAGAHPDADGMYSTGLKGEQTAASRIIQIVMRETDDGQMLFEPADMTFDKDETVVLSFKNTGANKHEFVMDTEEKIQEHKIEMEEGEVMDHIDDNVVVLEPGETGEIVWTFAKSGSFSFACLVPGHYDAGMHGKMTVN